MALDAEGAALEALGEIFAAGFDRLDCRMDAAGDRLDGLFTTMNAGSPPWSSASSAGAPYGMRIRPLLEAD